jgi:hypothetical protein
MQEGGKSMRLIFVLCLFTLSSCITQSPNIPDSPKKASGIYKYRFSKKNYYQFSSGNSLSLIADSLFEESELVNKTKVFSGDSLLTYHFLPANGFYELENSQFVVFKQDSIFHRVDPDNYDSLYIFKSDENTLVKKKESKVLNYWKRPPFAPIIVYDPESKTIQWVSPDSSLGNKVFLNYEDISQEYIHSPDQKLGKICN